MDTDVNQLKRSLARAIVWILLLLAVVGLAQRRRVVLLLAHLAALANQLIECRHVFPPFPFDHLCPTGLRR